MTGGQLDRQVAAYFSQLLDISQHEIRVAEELSERLEEEYQLHLQRNRQTAQENFPLNRFEGTSKSYALIKNPLKIHYTVQDYMYSV